MDVEIKVNFTGSQIEEAKQEFGLDDDKAEDRTIWFGEVLTGRDGRDALPLLERGVILRLRAKKKSGDVTLKLRGPDGCIDATAWDAAVLAGEKKLEGDWADHRLVSASLTAKSDEAGREDFEDGVPPPIGTLMSAAQRDLAGRLMIPVAEVELLGPIAARKWDHEDIGGDIDAEEWTAGTQHFLELSVRTSEDPENARKELRQRVADRGLELEECQGPKTTIMLTYLAGGDG